MINQNKFCPHCWPVKRKHHLDAHLDYYLEKIFVPLFAHSGFARAADRLWILIIKTLRRLGLVRFDPSPDESQIYNRSAIFLREARKRGIQIETVRFFGRYKNDFRFIYKGTEHFYESIPLLRRAPSSAADGKYEVKRILRRHRLPVAEGELFTSPAKAFEFARRLGYPLAVKPNRASLSCHATYPVSSDAEMEKAVAVARQFRPDFIVERFVLGNLYRATVVGGKHVFVCRKERANVIGNGSSSIRQLIERKNNDRKRGETDQKNSSLHKIPLDGRLESALAGQGLSLASVPRRGRKIYLTDKFILTAGCDITACTKDAHPENRKLFLDAAAALGLDLVGIDVIMADIRRPYQEQETAILEANTVPYIDMHQFPSRGPRDEVAKTVWDVVLEGLQKA